MLQMICHHLGIEVATATGDNLLNRYSESGYPAGIVFCLDIALQDTDPDAMRYQ
jgi:hypothetical protein